MILFLEDLGNNKEAILEEAVKEVNRYIDNKDYLKEEDNELSIIATTKEDTEMLGVEFLYGSYSFWKELYKEVPEFLIFIQDNIFFEICLAYHINAKTDSRALTNYSYSKAIERGIEEDYLDGRFNHCYNAMVS